MLTVPVLACRRPFGNVVARALPVLHQLKIASVYFLLVFAAGFALGAVRIMWLVPRVGVRTAELLETPLMILVTWMAARWIVRHFSVPHTAWLRFRIGAVALLLLVLAELAVGFGLRHLSLSEMVLERDPVSGPVYLFSLLLYGLMPALAGREP